MGTVIMHNVVSVDTQQIRLSVHNRRRPHLAEDSGEMGPWWTYAEGFGGLRQALDVGMTPPAC
jgi:hypothetical protein